MAAPALADLERAIVSWKEEGVDIVVSLLERSEIPGFVEEEGGLCDEMGLEFLWFPVKDGSVPASADAFRSLAMKLADAVATGRSVAIHCRAGIGRSGMLAACVLSNLNVDADIALDMITDARSLEVPQTEEQRQWVLGFQAS